MPLVEMVATCVRPEKRRNDIQGRRRLAFTSANCCARSSNRSCINFSRYMSMAKCCSRAGVGVGVGLKCSTSHARWRASALRSARFRNLTDAARALSISLTVCFFGVPAMEIARYHLHLCEICSLGDRRAADLGSVTVCRAV